MTEETASAPGERARTSPHGTEQDGGVKADLHRYLKKARENLRWKLDGLAERELRMPMTRTGTNLLGLLKHVSSVEVGYFTDCFGRPSGIDVPWLEDEAEPNADMYATAEESVESVFVLADRCAAASDAVIDDLDLDAVGTVPWWNDESVTLGELMVHVLAEYQRHLGHADIVRELLDGQAGLSARNSNLPGGMPDDAPGTGSADWWAGYVDRLRAIAESAPRSGSSPQPGP
ncbi:DinB family protein [Citricoccus sp. GCM10030269]|uniref:DinB family protein n=1 Tax=Citricoccus sp. GCM10030269 TaxID=3273388 RepID=UPI003611A50C